MRVHPDMGATRENRKFYYDFSVFWGIRASDLGKAPGFTFQRPSRGCQKLPA